MCTSCWLGEMQAPVSRLPAHCLPLTGGATCLHPQAQLKAAMEEQFQRQTAELLAKIAVLEAGGRK